MNNLYVDKQVDGHLFSWFFGKLNQILKNTLRDLATFFKGIPHLGVLKTDGSIISKNGQTAAEGDGLVPFLSRCEDWTCKDIPLKLTKVGNKVE